MRILSRNLPVLPVLLVATAALAQNQVVLKTQLPPPLFVGRRRPSMCPILSPPMRGKRPDFYVPAGTINLAKNKKVTSSDNNPDVGTLDMIDDGDKDGDEGSWVELGPGKQWVQIDLARKANIYAVLVWHFHSQARVYRDVVVQVSDDPMFKSGVTTIFNNDFSQRTGPGRRQESELHRDVPGQADRCQGREGPLCPSLQQREHNQQIEPLHRG